MPKLSVIMSTYNDSQYIRESIDSILDQTFRDFEFIIIDDASTDNTVEIIRSYTDDRIKLIINEENQGLTKNLNKALTYVTGEYIARMDGDDISLPERFAKQVAYLDNHKDVYLIGCAVKSFGASDLIWLLPDDSEELRVRMLIRPVFAHPSFMFRKKLIDEGFRYDETFRTAQDYDFASRVAKVHKIGRVQDILMKYRVHDKQISSTSSINQLSNADRIRSRLLQELGITLNKQQQAIYNAFVAEKCPDSIETFLGAADLINELTIANNNSKVYYKKTLAKTLKKMLYTWVIRSKKTGYILRFPQVCQFNIGNMRIFVGEIIRTLKEKKIKPSMAM